jgi:DNA-binding transcriptional MocR family regulator
MSPSSVNAPTLARMLDGPPERRPYYAELARGLRGLVLDGSLPTRTRLPAERDLASALGVSRTTVTSAYDTLRSDGYAESRQGAGTWTALPGGVPPAARLPFGTGRALLDLGHGAPSAPPAFDECLAAAVAALDAQARGPGYEPLGLRELREAVARRYTERGAPTLPEQIIVTSGAQHALYLVLLTFARPGDAVLVESPTYPHALDALRRAGVRLIPAGVNAGWDVDLIGGAMRQVAARLAYLIPDFQNPTGRLMDDDRRAALAAAARSAGTHLVADESFAELAIDEVRMPRPMAAHDTDGRVISIGSAAKVFWGGMRIGWVRASQAIVARLAETREWVDLASPVLEQLVVTELFARLDSIVAERRAALRECRAALVEALRRECPGWEFTVPRGGLSLWARLPSTSSTALAAVAPRHGLHVVPGTAFGVDGVLDDRLRVPYVLPPDRLREAAVRLATACREAEAVPLSPRGYV